MGSSADQLSEVFGCGLSTSLMKLGIKRTVASDERVFFEGDKATFLPIVLEGSIKMVRYPEAGKEVIIGLFQPGDPFAIPPAMDGKLFPATAVAVEKSELLLVAREDFLELMRSSREFSEIIMQRMCGILRDRAQTVQILATPSAEHRVATVLLRLVGDIQQNEVKQISHRRQDIAEMAGLSLETTIRVIRRLADKGYLKIVRGRIVFETADRLREFAR